MNTADNFVKRAHEISASMALLASTLRVEEAQRVREAADIWKALHEVGCDFVEGTSLPVAVREALAEVGAAVRVSHEVRKVGNQILEEVRNLLAKVPDEMPVSGPPAFTLNGVPLTRENVVQLNEEFQRYKFIADNAPVHETGARVSKADYTTMLEKLVTAEEALDALRSRVRLVAGQLEVALCPEKSGIDPAIPQSRYFLQSLLLQLKSI